MTLIQANLLTGGATQLMLSITSGLNASLISMETSTPLRLASSWTEPIRRYGQYLSILNTHFYSQNIYMYNAFSKSRVRTQLTTEGSKKLTWLTRIMLLRRPAQRVRPDYQDSITRQSRCSGSAGVRCGAQNGQMENSSLRYKTVKLIFSSIFLWPQLVY